MTEFATLLVSSRGDAEEYKDKMENIRRAIKDIVRIMVLNSDPKLDAKIADITGATTAVRTGNTNTFMIEIKMGKNTDLESIKRRLRQVVGENSIMAIRTA